MKCYTLAKKIVTTLHNAGFTAYFAGGWVRDHLLAKDADDIDIATTATPDEIMGLFPKTIPVGINFSILIVVEDGVHFEVATFREDDLYHDGRRPSKITHATAIEDAKRRDFTINGMFFDPLTDTLYDYVHGKKDLENGIIRAIGDPHQRFKEDRLRMIRACRYSARFSFTIEENTKNAILIHAKELFPAVAIERVYDEFKKMTKDPHLFDALILMHEFGLLSVIFKELTFLPITELKKRIANTKEFPLETYPTIYLYQLFKDLSLKEKIAICKYFKVSNSEIKFTEELEKWKNWDKLSDFELANLYAHPLCKKFETIACIYSEDKNCKIFHKNKQEYLRFHIDCIKNNSPIVTSQDLINIGIAKGKELGIKLKLAEQIAVNKNLLSKEEIIALLQSENY
jgi:poly(A) polymerase